jgi:hypothetical protein
LLEVIVTYSNDIAAILSTPTPPPPLLSFLLSYKIFMFSNSRKMLSKSISPKLMVPEWRVVLIPATTQIDMALLGRRKTGRC